MTNSARERNQELLNHVNAVLTSDIDLSDMESVRRVVHAALAKAESTAAWQISITSDHAGGTTEVTLFDENSRKAIGSIEVIHTAIRPRD